MLLSGADILVRTLIEQGCDTVFGYPGGQIIHVYDSLYKYQDELTHVLAAHEQGATHAADGYARTTGKVGVVIATSGPGATNLVTGIALQRGIDVIQRIAALADIQKGQRIGVGHAQRDVQIPKADITIDAQHGFTQRGQSRGHACSDGSFSCSALTGQYRKYLAQGMEPPVHNVGLL